MNTRILKNASRNNLQTIFRGRKIYFLSKHSKEYDWKDEEHQAEYYHWTTIYEGLVIDITKRVYDERIKKGVITL